MAPVVTFGDVERFAFELRWRDSDHQRSFAFPTAATAAMRSRGHLVLWVGGRVVWGFERQARVRGVLWTWIELLEHLSRVWPYLAWEEGYPLGLGPQSPADLVAMAETVFADVSGVRRDEIDRTVYDFREAHDLSFGVPGVRLPSAWFVTLGKTAVIATGGFRAEMPRNDALEVLEALGSAIAERLGACGDSRAVAARDDWTARRDIGADKLAAIYTRLDDSRLSMLRGARSVQEAFELPESGEFEPTELLAAARGTASELSDEKLEQLLDAIRTMAKVATPQLDELGAEARTLQSEHSDEKPAEQAARLARWLRRRLGFGTQPIDPRRLMHRFGVAVRTLKLGVPTIDAVSVWGPRHGPAVLVNVDGMHAQRRAGLNSTIAHEICHLLLDRAGALPLGEVFSRSSLPIEARARAFAAELLMPAEVVISEFASRAKPQKILKTLCKRYQVSPELVAWQARNSGAQLSKEVFAFLRGQVSAPHAF